MPVAAASRRTLQCVVPSGGASERLGQHALHLIVTDRPWPSRPWRGLQALHPALREIPSPQPDRLQRHTHLPSDLVCYSHPPPRAARSPRASTSPAAADGVLSTARRSRSSSSVSSITAGMRPTTRTVPEVPTNYKRLMGRCTRGAGRARSDVIAFPTARQRARRSGGAGEFRFSETGRVDRGQSLAP